MFTRGALAAALVLFAAAAHADGLLLFPSLSYFDRYASDDPDIKAHEFVPALDIFYTANFDQFRFIGEYYASNREKEMERLQAGWRIMPGKTLWLGRFHNPLSFWNTELHHGNFLQTSISRPAIANYEDAQGILPAHITGLLLESSRAVDDAEISYAAGVGIGPTIETSSSATRAPFAGLKAFDLLDPKHPGKIAAGFRLAYHPEAASANQVGASLGYARIEARDLAPVTEVRQTVLGAFFTWEKQQLKFVGEAFALDHHVAGAANPSSRTVLSAYLQPEYRFNDSLAAFARVEGTSRAADSYLALLPEFPVRRVGGGIRFDFYDSHAVKVEFNRDRHHHGAEFSSLSVQWSMIYP